MLRAVWLAGLVLIGCGQAAPPRLRVDHAAPPEELPPEELPPEELPPEEAPPEELPPEELPPEELPPEETPPNDGACTSDDLPTPNAGIIEPPGQDGCPAGMAQIGAQASCMDRWEAFLEERTAEGAVPFSPFADPTGRDVVARSAPDAVPQGYISGISAASACAAAGKRLCTDAEWTRACGGAADTIYPYGNTREPGVCNDARGVHPVVEYFGTGDSWIWSELGHPCINQQDDTVDVTGANAGCVDDSGRFFDLMGNLHEWIDDPAGTFRGGFYVDTQQNGPGCRYRTTAHNTAHRDYSTGFRCCADLDP